MINTEQKTRLPQFLVVGAAKAGTTALHYMLDQHPDIYLPSQKETYFLTGIKPETYPDAGDKFKRRLIFSFDDYEALFQEAKSDQIIGETCVFYLYMYEQSIPHIQQYLKQPICIIMILRHPVDRAYSHYNYVASRHNWCLTFEDTLKREDNDTTSFWWNVAYKRVGLYYQQVKAYQDVFGKENVLILFYDEFKQNANNVLTQVFDFLDVNDYPVNTSQNFNMSYIPKNRKFHNLILGDLTKRLLKNFIPRHWRHAGIIWFKKKNNSTPAPMRTDTRMMLIDYYRDDILALQKRINVNLEHWLVP